MKTQKHNYGWLKNLTVNIEEAVVESIQQMSDNSTLSVDDIVVIALKRFRASHAELEGKAPAFD